MTLTGGEPLIRSDIVEIAKALYESGCRITFTTNDSLLGEQLEIRDYLSIVNVSFHSLDSDKYESIVGKKDTHHRMMESLKKFKARYSTLPITLNITLINDINASMNDILNVIEFARELSLNIKFIELFPASSDKFVSVLQVADILSEYGFVEERSFTRKKIFFDGIIYVALTKIFCANARDYANHGNYCALYNDLFVSPDGKFKPCRDSKIEIDMLQCVREIDETDTRNAIDFAFSMLGKYCSYEDTRGMR